jgi:hypothetical protein
MKRTGYDSNTRQYTFHDSTTGVQYISAPGERYGTLLPAATANYVKPKLGPGRRETCKYFLYANANLPFSHTRPSASVRPSGDIRRRRLRQGATTRVRLPVAQAQKCPKLPDRPFTVFPTLWLHSQNRSRTQRYLCRLPACRPHRSRGALRGAAGTTTAASAASKVGDGGGREGAA